MFNIVGQSFRSLFDTFRTLLVLKICVDFGQYELDRRTRLKILICRPCLLRIHLFGLVMFDPDLMAIDNCYLFLGDVLGFLKTIC